MPTFAPSFHMAVGSLWPWVALLALGVALLFDLHRKRRSKLNLPPGPPGIPVLGNLTIFTDSSKLPHHALADLSRRYGPLMFLHLGSTPCLVATSPQVCRELFKNQDQVFASRPNSSAVEHLAYAGNNIVFAPYGDQWRQFRKVATMELLSSKKTSQFESFRAAEASAMVRAIYSHTIYNQGKPVDLRMLFKALTFNFITQISFSKRFFEYELDAPLALLRAADESKEVNPEEAKEFSRCVEELNVLFGVQLIGDFIPSMSFLDRFTGYKPRMIRCHNKFDEFLSRIVEEHRKHPKETDGDFLDVLIELQQDNGSLLNDTAIKGLCLDMVVGGTDTSANSLEWIMAEIVRHPNIAAKLQAELDGVVGKDRLVREADIPNLPYLRAVVKEGFRLHPPGALNVPHVCVEQTKVMGYDIPKSTMVFTNVWAMHRDPALWDNPTDFLPDRFLEKPEIDVKGQHYQLLPFGTGRRGCPGIGLGLTMVQYALARLVQAFDWSPPKGMNPDDVDVDESWGLTLPRAHILEAVPTCRLSSHMYLYVMEI